MITCWLWDAVLAQRAAARRGGGGSTDGTGGSRTETLPAMARPEDEIVPAGASPARKPKRRLPVITRVSSRGPSAERMQPQSLSPSSAWLAQRHPDRGHALPPEQLHPGASCHKELVAKTGPRPSHKQTRIARPLPISASILSDSESGMRLFLRLGQTQMTPRQIYRELRC